LWLLLACFFLLLLVRNWLRNLAHPSFVILEFTYDEQFIFIYFCFALITLTFKQRAQKRKEKNRKRKKKKKK